MRQLDACDERRGCEAVVMERRARPIDAADAFIIALEDTAILRDEEGENDAGEQESWMRRA